jgi:hypothetical protein
MFFGVARLEFLIPQSQSLKEKRSILNRLKGRIESRFHISVAEVEFQELWQRGALGVALVTQGMESARNALQAVRREVEHEPRVEVLEFRTSVAAFRDLPSSGFDGIAGGEE